jgi:hypothetical protein
LKKYKWELWKDTFSQPRAILLTTFHPRDMN